MTSPDTHHAINLILSRVQQLQVDIREVLNHPNCHNCLICQRAEADRRAGL